jgi:quinol monooxygenase YgiN
MNQFVIIVDFRLKPGARADFLRLINENARASCREEPGCQRFDVLATQTDADRIVLYEIYDDRAAFDAHLRTRHFASFNEASGALVVDKKVTEFAMVCEGSAA